MRFDRTNGKEARYMVNIYEGNVDDHYYYHYFRDADKMFNGLLRIPKKKGTSISLYDMKKDVRKAFQKF